MKTHTLLLGLLTLALTSLGCGGGGIGSFTFTEDSQEVTVEGAGTLGGVLPDEALSVFKLNVDLEQELEKRDAKGAKAVYLTDLQMQITDTEQPEGDTDNFDFLDAITIDVAADGQETRQLATLDPVPTGQTTITLDVDDGIDLKPYIEAGMNLDTNASGSRPADDTSLKVVATIRVKVL
ncbi:MAG: hypothetical protein ACQEVA_16595 [Myxococcota bacterium]